MTPSPRVVLFSGHMVDHPDRPTPRFPARIETAVADAIDRALTGCDVAARDIGLCGGACGGDLLFAEAALARGMVVHLQLPFETPAFLDQSVRFAGDDWVTRFNNVVEHDNTTVGITDTSPEGPVQEDRFARNNLELLRLATSRHPTPHCIVLWNGATGDGPGGTEHMVHSIRDTGGDVTIIDPADLA